MFSYYEEKHNNSPFNETDTELLGVTLRSLFLEIFISGKVLLPFCILLKLCLVIGEAYIMSVVAVPNLTECLCIKYIILPPNGREAVLPPQLDTEIKVMGKRVNSRKHTS